MLGRMPACPVDQHTNEVLGAFLCPRGEQHCQQLGIGQGQAESGQAPALRPDGRNHIDALPHDLPRHGRPQRLGGPAAPGAIAAPTAPFIFGPQQPRAGILRVAGPQKGLYLLGEGFFNAACSSVLACG